jgi:hypothetical protein
MNTETIEYKDYKIEVAQDDSLENPFEAWDCEPPLVTYYGGRHGYAKSYQDAPETWWDVLRMMPEACFKRGQRVALIKAMLNCTLKEFAQEKRRVGFVDTMAEMLGEQVGAKPEGWRSAIEWFEMAESLLTWAGIECVNTQSNGYSQGDSTLVLAIASPEWLKETGIKPEHVKSSLQASVDLYGAWAWGDVYGVQSIHKIETDEDGDETEGKEIEDASCWGFYGRDFEKSGLMEHARGAIDYAIKQEAETALNEPACLI